MVIAVFGQPRTGVFAHMDSVGFTVGYDRELIKIGNPKAKAGSKLVGRDSKGKIECIVEKPKEAEKKKDKKAKKKKSDKKDELPEFRYKFKRKIDPGTPLNYASQWKETKNYVRDSYMDNRLGVWNALQQAETLKNGALAFTTYEEHGGGGAQFAGRFLQDAYGIQQGLISDVTLTTKHIKHDNGVAISMRDKGVPRQSYIRKIIGLANEAGIKHQLEVEKSGGSDGNALQDSSHIWDWCFIGPPETNYHQPGEKVHKRDIENAVELYGLLLEKL
jgi:putative aminopeptidase FrvX